MHQAENPTPRPQAIQGMPQPGAISASGPSGRQPEAGAPSRTSETKTEATLISELDLQPAPARFMSRLKAHGVWALNRDSEAAPMLPPFIIDQIRRREEEERRRIERDQPRVELPVDAYRPAPRPQPDAEEPDDPERGVVILDLG
jgi:hypothetical protein